MVLSVFVACTPIVFFIRVVIMLLYGQTLGHFIRNYEVLDKTSGGPASIPQMLFKYLFVTPISHSSSIAIIANGYLLVNSTTPDCDTIEDLMCHVEVVHKIDKGPTMKAKA